MALKNLIIGKLNSLYYLCAHHWRYVIRLGSISNTSRLLSPLSIEGGGGIFIESYVVIEKQTWLATRQIDPVCKPQLIIEEGCRIGHFNHIYCTGKITIQKDVLTADKVYISDNVHSFQDITIPIWQQPVRQLNEVVIGRGAWLGENVCVLGASVGKGSVIGANSVVTKDIPDYCVAVGAPAKVIKKYNPETNQWVTV